MTAQAMSDVLTEEEEGVLSMVRCALAEIRVRSGCADMDAIREAVISAGALMLEDEGECGTYSLGTTRFTIRSLRAPPGGIELSFQEPLA